MELQLQNLQMNYETLQTNLVEKEQINEELTKQIFTPNGKA